MNQETVVAIPVRESNPLADRLLAKLREFGIEDQYSILFDPIRQTVARNRNHLLRQARAANYRRICFLDDDVVPLTPNWLSTLLGAQAGTGAGIVSCLETKDGKVLFGRSAEPSFYGKIVQVQWWPSFVFLMDIENELWFDERIQATAFDDLDMCFQMGRTLQKMVMVDGRVVVLHSAGEFGDEQGMRKNVDRNHDRLFEEAKQYIQQKWGIQL